MNKKEPLIHTHELHPVFRQKLTFGQKAADVITQFGGSWTFIIIFAVVLVTWIAVNSWALIVDGPFDPYPFILLNLVLSTLAAIQAPIILMSQNRNNERDRIHAHRTSTSDYRINPAEITVSLHQHNLFLSRKLSLQK